MTYQEIYNTRKCSFEDGNFFAKYFEDKVGARAEHWCQFFANWSYQRVLNHFYKIIKDNEFHDIYKRMLLNIQDELGQKIIYQKLPTFRYQPAGHPGTLFHSDNLTSGHGNNIINFWIPLVNTNINNTLHFVKDKLSKNIYRDFVTERQPLATLEKQCRSFAMPIVCKQNEYLRFSNNSLHGALKNTSSSSRFSIDFRILIDGEDPGIKKIGHDYFYLEPKLQVLSNGISYIYSSGDLSHISHECQRRIVEEYAQSNGIKINREFAEFYNVDHYPVLHNLIEENDFDNLIIFSEKCIPGKMSWIRNNSASIAKNKSLIHFAFENIKYPPA